MTCYSWCSFTLVSLTLGIFSCTHSDNTKNNVALIPSDNTITLSLDSVSPHFGSAPQLFYDKSSDSTFLVLKNQLIRSIDIYSYPDGLLCRRIIPDSQGENGIGELTGFQILNRDSIIAISHYEFSIAIIDWQAKLIDKFYAPDRTVNLRVNGAKHASLIGLNLYVPLEDFTNYGSSDWSAGALRTIYKIDLVTKQFSHLAPFPSSYQAHNTSMGFIRHSSIIQPYPSDNIFIISYPLSPDIVVLKDDSIAQIIPIKSDIYQEVKPIDFELMPIDPHKQEKHFYGNFSYGNITFDMVNKVYYRFMWFPIKLDNKPNKDYDEVFENIYSQRSFAVDILNENFELLSSQKFQHPHSYDPNIFFVSPDGLCIYEKSSDPDEMKFRIFKLSHV